MCAPAWLAFFLLAIGVGGVFSLAVNSGSPVPPIAPPAPAHTGNGVSFQLHADVVRASWVLAEEEQYLPAKAEVTFRQGEPGKVILEDGTVSRLRKCPAPLSQRSWLSDATQLHLHGEQSLGR